MDFQCNLNTGQCKCHPKFSGTKCTECTRGHWNYPHCSPCDCFLPGTDDSTCDLETKKCSCIDQTGQCTCKVCAAEIQEGRKKKTLLSSMSIAVLTSVIYFCIIKLKRMTYKNSLPDAETFPDIQISTAF